MVRLTRTVLQPGKVAVKGNSCVIFYSQGKKPVHVARKSTLTRKDYDAVEVGMDKAGVVKALGEPAEKFTNVYMYLDDDPMGNTEAHVYFDAAGKVVGKRFDNSARPGEKDRRGNIPK